MTTELSRAQRELVRWARVARLATVDATGTPHVVPVSPVLDGDTVVFASVDAGPKIRNIEANGRAALVFDDYLEDWNHLPAQVLVRGRAGVVREGDRWERGRRLLYEKFPQYESTAPIEPGSSVIVEVLVEEVAGGS